MLDFTTKCHPEANGRAPVTGEHQWAFTFTLDDGQELVVHMGKEAHDTFRGFILREEIEDVADVAESSIEGEHHPFCGLTPCHEDGE